MGDTDADNPEVIGEASILMANTCFPHEGLNGGNGHVQLDVTCMVYIIFVLIVDVVFFTEFKDVSNTEITNFNALRTIGDEKMNELLQLIKKTKNN